MLAAALAEANQSDLDWTVQVWRWIGRNDAQIQALAAVAVLAVTLMILLVYRRQARIMDVQAEILAAQSAPVVTTDPSDAVSIHLGGRPGRKPTARNVGRGPAFELDSSFWWVSSSGERYGGKVQFDNDFLSVDASTAISLQLSQRLLPEEDRWAYVIHYRDELGRARHTTMYIDPETGEHCHGPLVAWDPARWKRNRRVQRFCKRCRSGHGRSDSPSSNGTGPVGA